MQERDRYVLDLYAGADPHYRLPITIVAEYAWHALFVKQLFVRPNAEELAAHAAEFTVIAAPEFEAVPERDGTTSSTFIITDFARKIVLIGGTHYAGEMKKSVFTHAELLSAREGRDADALLGQCRPERRDARSSSACPAPARPRCRPIRNAHADRRRRAWLGRATASSTSKAAATPSASSCREEAEPEIYRRHQALRHGAGERRAATPTPACPISTTTRRPRTPAPPIRSISSRTRRAPAAPATRKNVRDPDRRRVRRAAADREADAGAGDVSLPLRLHREGRRHRDAASATSRSRTSRPASASPFLPRHPSVYRQSAARALIAKHDVDCWLVNTGWTGGKFGVGRRMPITYAGAGDRGARRQPGRGGIYHGAGLRP